MEGFFIQNAQIILGVLLSLVSSIATLVVSEVFTSRRFDKERKFLYKKEKYLELQKSTRLIFNSLESYKMIVGNIQISLNNGLYDLTEFDPKTNKEKYGSHQQNLFNETIVWFPSLEGDYNDIAKSFINISNKFFPLTKGQYTQPLEFEGMRCFPITISDHDKGEIAASITEFSKKIDIFARKVSDILKTVGEDLEQN
ncbi:MAG: hypothetical protein ACD_8C00124G0012 [uncultured bacterium]|nr:MAG: hypothetical protein ACD_8C00124G0012 [uncultured bacterium]